MPDQWVTIPQAAEHLNVSTKTIRRWISSGDIEAVRIGKHLIRVDLSTVKMLPLQHVARGAVA